MYIIGKKVKKIRRAQAVTLSELAQKSGVQIATLSRIENLKMTGTLESHIKIAKALGVNIAELYQDIAYEEPQTNTPLTETFSYNEKASYEILTSKVLSKKMMPVILKIEPGGKTNIEQNPPGTEKFIFVLTSDIIASIGDNNYTLPTNNTLYFDASLPHFFRNVGETTAKVISVVTPVAL